ncbi:serine/threonine-protein phosphatase 6 regulatory ankyrin repeat subunit A-like [Trichogramma pretiosum]|uniref:serine/threonine-protein phosphatase 6 regulatory ankyrin repeat subunit A-like n=1 Tax=Trichogramma pretiosum TaxID=7493 RepID=UPI0006C9547D|nr:serine/threonine-protein phosphatase 6 regulatory ankyrin repeat subunit A-like [Trichogramma pretiosum]
MAQNDRHSLTLLKTLKAKVNFEVTKQRRKFLPKLYRLIKKWRGQLPNLLEIFREEEIKWLLAEAVKNSDEWDPLLLANFAIDSGYRDEPDLDEDGKPILRRTTLIHHAAEEARGKSAILNLFTLYNRFDVNYIDDDGYTHFHVACIYGLDDVVARFLQLGQDPNCVCPVTGSSPLHLAQNNNKKEVVKLLLKNGANLILADKDGTTPLHLICDRFIDEDWTEEFFEICSDRLQTVEIDVRNKEGHTPLSLALMSNSNKAVETLLRNGADPNLTNEEGQTPLHMIGGWTREVAVKTFLDISDAVNRPVQVDARDNEGNRPLHVAAKRGSDDAIELLLRRGADPNLANEEGQTPLHLICKRISWVNACNDLTKLFFDVCDELNQTVQIDGRDKFGLTPLRWAVASVKPAAVDSLLDRGADLSGFVFPAVSHLAEACSDMRPDSNQLNFKLKLASGLLDCVERLQERGYELDRSDARTIMEFFAERELFQKPGSTRWYCDPKCVGEALTKTMVKEGLSLQDLIEARPREAKKLMTCRDYYNFACSPIDWRLYPCSSTQKACEVELYERASRGFFKSWALQPFLELMHYRLPIEMCEIIIDQLSNQDLYNVCLAVTPGSN